MTLLLQSRLLDTIRQELGGTYSITVIAVRGEVSAAGVPCADRLDVRPRADREPRAARVRGDRVRQGRRRCRHEQVALIRDVLLRDFEKNSQDNGYLLNQISRRYEDGDAANVAAP